MVINQLAALTMNLDRVVLQCCGRLYTTHIKKHFDVFISIANEIKY